MEYNDEDITEACEKCLDIRPLSHLSLCMVGKNCCWLCAKCKKKLCPKKPYNIDEAVRQVLDSIGVHCKNNTQYIKQQKGSVCSTL